MTLTVELVLFILALFGAVGGVWWRWQNQLSKIRDELNAHRVHVAEAYATKLGMQEQTAQITRAIEGVLRRVDSLHERLDRALERE